MNDRLAIDTPENIILSAQIAGYGTRCIAAILDYLILLIFIFIFSYLYVQSLSMSDRSGTGFTVMLFLIQFLLIAFYHLVLELLWNGQTIGKRIVGARVVQANGLPATASGIVIRNLVRLFDFLPVFYGIGLIVMFASGRTQRLGDLAGGTIVIREQRSLTINKVKENVHVTYHFINLHTPLPHYLSVAGLSDDDRRVVYDFLQRRYDIRDRGELAKMLAKRIAANMAGAPRLYTDREAETFLEQVARAYEVEAYR